MDRSSYVVDVYLRKEMSKGGKDIYIYIYIYIPASVPQWYSESQIKLWLIIRILLSVLNYHIIIFHGVIRRGNYCLVILTH